LTCAAIARALADSGRLGITTVTPSLSAGVSSVLKPPVASVSGCGSKLGQETQRLAHGRGRLVAQLVAYGVARRLHAVALLALRAAQDTRRRG
jgi:hypothetical protein